MIRELLPTERLLFESDTTCVGTFGCDVRDPLFHRESPSTAHCIVFSRTAVWIQHEDGPRYVADPTVVTFHNRDRTYQRWRIADADRCDWIAFADEALRDVLRDRWFPREFTPVASAVYARQRRLFDRVTAGVADAMEVEEEATLLLDEVLTPVTRLDQAGSERTRLTRGNWQRSDFDAVQHVRACMAADPGAATSLRALAKHADMTPFRLCRAFSRVSGETMTAYRTRLRLLSSLERLRARESITDIALAFGFSSHSHYTAAFRMTFGTTPMQWRRAC